MTNTPPDTTSVYLTLAVRGGAAQLTRPVLGSTGTIEKVCRAGSHVLGCSMHDYGALENDADRLCNWRASPMTTDLAADPSPYVMNWSLALSCELLQLMM